jgi:23S rRNA (adenine2030-N6)-methyltransferase
MNYRHSFHAGNFADVLKHAILARILTHLAAKGTPFRVIDTHAGIGLYDLAGEDAGRTNEWRDGIGRLDIAPLPPEAEALLGAYRSALRAARSAHGKHVYPGSPWITQHLLRREDRLIAAELHPKIHAGLTETLGKDIRCKTLRLDGWIALRANVPPKERRGLVLIDPPFEKIDEFETMARELVVAHAKWPTGIYMCWYPIKDPGAAQAFTDKILEAGIGRLLRLELSVDRPDSAGGLSACGLLIVNPPWTMQKDAELLLPALARKLAQGQKPRYLCQSIAADGLSPNEKPNGKTP